MKELTFDQLRQANTIRNEEWINGKEKVSLSFRATELAGEVGEACNIIKKLERERLGIVGSRSSLQELAEELADVLICVDLMAMDLGIDMSKALAEKFNKTSRKYGLNTFITAGSIPVNANEFIRFPENNDIQFCQDFGFFVGVPSDVDFYPEKILENGGVVFVGDGFGLDIEHKVKGEYGDGSMLVFLSQLSPDVANWCHINQGRIKKKI